MDKSRANILQIQKYLNGELDAKAMHQLEREAQGDPFLMDALEGYQAAGGNQQPNLDILAQRLDARVNPKVRRIIPWATVSLAAGVVGLLIVVGLLYKTNEPAKLQQTAEVTVQPRLKADTVIAPPVSPGKTNEVVVLQQKKPVVSKPARVFYANANKDRAVVARVQEKKIAEPPAASPLAEVAVAPPVEKAATPLDELIMGTIVKQRDSVVMPATVAIAQRPISQPLNGKVKGVSTSDIRPPANQYELQKLNLPTGYAATIANNSNKPQPNLNSKGVVEPAAQVSGNIGYLASPATNEATFKSFGQQPANYNYSNSAGLNTNKGFSNDSAIGYSGGANSVNALALAHPQKGWVMYQLYLSQKCTLPMGETPGVVEIKFTIGTLGDISNITVVKSLSPAADKKAIQIINDGPKWVGNTNGKPEEKTLQLDFVNK